MPDPLDYATPNPAKRREHIPYEGLGLAGFLTILGVVLLALLILAGILLS